MIAAPTATLDVTVRTSRMPHGSEFKRIHKAVEHLYYLVLFSQVPEYKDRKDTWQSWLETGTDLGVREAPRGVARQDRYVESIYSGPREIRIKARGNAQALEQLSELVQNVRAAEQQLQGSVSGRFAELLAQSATSLTVADVVGIEAGVTGG